jgi:hypothetical protein
MVPTLLHHGQLTRELLEDLNAYEREALAIYSEAVAPAAAAGRPSFGRTLHSYMMGLMARVDLASLYWQGTKGGQTQRMQAFMQKYVCSDAEVNRILVKMWRHTLMHTAKPRLLTRKTGDPYYWLLHWKESLPRSIHLTFLDEPGMRKLNIGMLYFAEDLKRGFEAYLTDVASDQSLLAKAMAAQLIIEGEARI